MGWTVEGSGFHANVGEYGLCVRGEGRQIYKSSLSVPIDMSETASLPASWELHRASQAAELASMVSLDVRNMKRYLDASTVKATTKPIGIVTHHERIDSNDPRQIGFCAFLPDDCFNDVWRLLKLFLLPVKYWLSFQFIGFIPHPAPDDPEVISYDEWLAGRPCLIEGFGFTVAPSKAARPI